MLHCTFSLSLSHLKRLSNDKDLIGKLLKTAHTLARFDGTVVTSTDHKHVRCMLIVDTVFVLV